MQDEETEMLTAEEVSKIMKVNVRTVRNWVQAGDLTPTWIGKREYRISRADLRIFIQKRKGKQSPDTEAN